MAAVAGSGPCRSAATIRSGPSIVIGAFADYDFSGIKGDLAFNASGAAEEKLKILWAAGGRSAGFRSSSSWCLCPAATPRRGSANQPRLGFNPRCLACRPKHTYTGWFIGAGYEYGLGWLPGLFWKTEYRFADYGSDSVRLSQRRSR